MTRPIQLSAIGSALFVGLVFSGTALAHGGHEHGASAPSVVSADEKAAYDRAEPVFAKFCFACHSTKTGHKNEKALEHMNMDAYPFGGHHAQEAGSAIREVLGGTGKPPTMPDDDPGAVKGDDLKVVLAWADEFDKSHPRDSEGDHDGAGHAEEHDHDHAGHDHAHGAGDHQHMGMDMHMDHGAATAGTDAQLAYATPRETLIPGRPGMAGGFHLMLNAYAYVTSPGLDGYSITNAGHSYDGGEAHPLLTGDWVMGYWRESHGWAEAHLMLNFEPFTVGKGGYPELGQAGEGLVDAQHSHQLIHQAMVAIHPLAGTASGAAGMGHEPEYELSIFAGQGSATIGPPIFMHRASSPGPTVPRKHHKGENPHETFPVLGASFRFHDFWIEGSAFSALELTPDDSRFYPHAAAPASFAARLRYDLGDRAELQVSGERLRDQGNGEPDAWQASASAYLWGSICNWRIDGLLDYAADVPDDDPSANALLGEVALRSPTRREIFWARSELNQREETPAFGGGVSSPWLFETIGAEHVFTASSATGLQLGFFAEATLAPIPSDVQGIYGRDNAVTLDVGLHLFGMWMLDGDLRRMEHSHGGGAEMSGM
jgi:hypothetical protein